MSEWVDPMDPAADEKLADLRSRARKKSLTPSQLKLLETMEVQKAELAEQATRIQASFRAKKGREIAKTAADARDSAAATKIQTLRRAQQARRKSEAVRVAKRRSYRSVSGMTVVYDYEPQLYFADRFRAEDDAESCPFLPKLKVFQGDCVDILDKQGDMVHGRQGENTGWFPAVCVGMPMATYSKEANRPPPRALNREFRSLTEIRREVEKRKEKEARAIEEARAEAARIEAEKAALEKAERERELERRATLTGGYTCDSLPPQLTSFFSNQKTALAAIRHERLEMRARRGASLVYNNRKQPWRM